MRTPEEVKQETNRLVNEVLAGLWGSGYELQVRLTNAGYNYDRIMKYVERKRQRTYVQSMLKMWQDS